MDINNINVGIRIAETRKRRNYSREKLSELAEVSVQFLADIEKGRKTMTITTLRRVAAALNVTTDYIVNGTEAYSENVYIKKTDTISTAHLRKPTPLRTTARTKPPILRLLTIRVLFSRRHTSQ